MEVTGSYSSPLFHKIGNTILVLNLATRADVVAVDTDDGEHNVQEVLEQLQSDLSGVESTASNNSKEITNLKKQFSSLEANVTEEVESLQSAVSGIDNKLEELKSDTEKTLKDLNDKVDSIEKSTNGALSDIRESVSSLEDNLNNLTNRVTTVEEELKNLKKTTEDSLKNLGNKVDSLESTVTEKITSIENSIEEIDNSLKTNSYEFSQASALSDWSIQHNLNSKNVLIKTFDSEGNEIIGFVDYKNATTNSITVKFDKSISGSALVYKLK